MAAAHGAIERLSAGRERARRAALEEEARAEAKAAASGP